MEKEAKIVKKRLRSDNAIPDYDYLFNEDSNKNDKKHRGFLWKILKVNFWKIFFVSLLYILQAAPVWAMPLITADIINIANAGLTDTTWQTIAIDSAILAVLLLQNVPTTVFRSKILYKLARNASAGIKSSVVRKLQSLSITYHKDIQTGKIQSKFLKDTDSIEALLINIMQSIIPNILSVIISAAIAIYKSGIVSLFFLLVIPFNVGLTMFFRNRIRKSNRNYRHEMEDMSAKLSNMLEMMSVTKSHGLEETEIVAFKHNIKKLVRSGLILDGTNAHFGAWSWVLNNLLSIVCLIFCSILALLGHIPLGDIVLYQSLFGQISAYVSGLINIVPQIGTGMEAISSVSEIMNSHDVEVNLGKGAVPEIIGNVTFDDVSYKYPDSDQYVIKDFSLDVKQGECIAVVGPSGSGKSTIMNMIIGFLIPDKGRLLIDGKPLTEFNLSEYRHNISVVPQNSILFSGTIRENITYGLSQYSEEDLQRVVEMANIKEFLSELPNGIDTNIGEHGGKLSGGQKQRITIARALIRNPKILILDEATSALDNISEYHVQKAIASSIKGRTTFIVAHRLSTIRDADRIVVMDAGVCVETGTYEELMAKKGKFYELKNLNDMNLKEAEENLA